MTTPNRATGAKGDPGEAADHHVLRIAGDRGRAADVGGGGDGEQVRVGGGVGGSG